jgi:hypothetical protein
MKFKPELAAAVAEIRQKGFTDIRIDGAFRLSTGFAAGAAAPRAAGLTVAFRDWSSSGESTEFPVAVTEHHVGNGDELAVALCVTGHIERDVLEYIQANSLPVAKLIEVTPGSGVGQTSIPGEGEALGFVFAAFDEIRRSARSAAKLHLFQSAPNGIGILLGDLWNRVPVTQLYDDAIARRATSRPSSWRASPLNALASPAARELGPPVIQPELRSPGSAKKAICSALILSSSSNR